MAQSLKTEWSALSKAFGDLAAIQGVVNVPGWKDLEWNVTELLALTPNYEADVARLAKGDKTAQAAVGRELTKVVTAIKDKCTEITTRTAAIFKTVQGYRGLGMTPVQSSDVDKVLGAVGTFNQAVATLVAGLPQPDELGGLTEAKYAKARFLAVSMMSGPGWAIDSSSGKAKLDFTKYVGETDPADDVAGRVAFIVGVADYAHARIKDTDSDTLKVLLFPEFLCRGPAGAYDFADVDSLTMQLQDKVKDATKWKDWLFVFGTFVVAADGKVKNDSGQFREATAEEIKAQTAGLEEKKLVTNYVLIQKGGFATMLSAPGSATVVQKLKISGIDFLKTSADLSLTGADVVNPSLSGGGGKDPYDPQAKVQEIDDLIPYYGGAIFEMDGLKVSQEVCLDFCSKRLRNNTDTEAKAGIQVQMVVSCGGWVNKGESYVKTYFQDRCVAKAGGWMVGCDGLNGCEVRLFEVLDGTPTVRNTAPAATVKLDGETVPGTAKTFATLAAPLFAPRYMDGAFGKKADWFYLVDFGAKTLPA